MTEGGLVLWDVDFVLDWTKRNETYTRLRSRASAGKASISVQAFAEVLRLLRLRLSEDLLVGVIAEIREQFVILDLTAERAETYAQVVDACRKAPDADVAQEAWFAWQVALARSGGHRIMTKAPQRYRGLVDPGDLA